MEHLVGGGSTGLAHYVFLTTDKTPTVLVTIHSYCQQEHLANELNIIQAIKIHTHFHPRRVQSLSLGAASVCID
eukprot:5968916-Amphidinium_carterae.1